MLHKAKYKTRLTQNKKAKHTSNAYERERETVIKSLGAFFLPHVGRKFLFSKPLIQR